MRSPIEKPKLAIDIRDEIMSFRCVLEEDE